MNEKDIIRNLISHFLSFFFKMLQEIKEACKVKLLQEHILLSIHYAELSFEFNKKFTINWDYSSKIIFS